MSRRSILSPRQERVLAALLSGPVSRENIDRIARASNGPHVVSALRARGVSIDCRSGKVIDHDGRACYPGTYSITDNESRKIAALLLAGGCTHG